MCTLPTDSAELNAQVSTADPRVGGWWRTTRGTQPADTQLPRNTIHRCYRLPKHRRTVFSFVIFVFSLPAIIIWKQLLAGSLLLLFRHVVNLPSDCSILVLLVYSSSRRTRSNGPLIMTMSPGQFVIVYDCPGPVLIIERRGI